MENMILPPRCTWASSSAARSASNPRPNAKRQRMMTSSHSCGAEQVEQVLGVGDDRGGLGTQAEAGDRAADGQILKTT
ncbi:MAG: hypothetical protein NCW75_04425 [Phycisphaera sp.]|nr:MAG: hypothetical protein NCW75_04425 [Phycisphaera sp.]